MKRAIFAVLCLGLCIALHPAFGADDVKKPAAPADDKCNVGDVQTQTLKGFTYLYVEQRIKWSTMGDAVKKMLAGADKALEDSHAKRSGPVIFIYHGASEDPNAEFDLAIGYPIAEMVKPVGDAKVREVPEYYCMSVVYTGSLKQFDASYQKLMPATAKHEAGRTGESREMYTYFEDPMSPNNIVHVSVGLKKP